MSQLLCHALTERHAVPDILFYIKRLILIFVERSHIRVGKLVNAFDINRCGIKHNRNQLLRITVDSRRCGFSATCLRHIKHPFQVEVNPRRTVLLGVLVRVENDKGFRAFVDLYALGNPIVKFLDLTCLRKLLIHQQGIVRRISVHTALHIEVAPEFFRGLHHLGGGIIEHLIYRLLFSSLFFLIFLRRKLRAVI